MKGEKLNYIEYEGRKISTRPSVDKYEINEDGEYERQIPWFRCGFAEGENPVEANRYIYFWAKDCAWSNRIAIILSLLGLEDIIKEEIVDWTKLDIPVGWEFINSENSINKESGARFIGELYYHSDSNFYGRPSVPLLYDYKRKIIANNDFDKMSYYLENEFRAFHKPASYDLFPKELQNDIIDMNKWIYERINNSIYKMFFAQNVRAYDKGYRLFREGLETLEKRLENSRFIFGDCITDSDIRVFSTLVRFDINYAIGIKLKERLSDYKNLNDYCKKIYQIEEVKNKTFFAAIYRGESNQKIIEEIENSWNKPINR